MKKLHTTTLLLGSLLCFGAIASVPVEVKSEFKTDFASLQYSTGGNTKYVSKQSTFGDYGVPKPNEEEDKMSLDLQNEIDHGNQGECVSFVKAVSNAGGTGSWIKGVKVTKNKLPKKWSVIATFTGTAKNGKVNTVYGNNSTSHVAVFIKKSSNGKGIWVIDQNWDNLGHVIYHYIPFSSNGIYQSQATNYYVVKQ